MKPSDIITESIEHRELEEAPMGFWKNLGYKVAGSVLNPFDSRSLYQGKQEIGKRADALAREFRKYLATVPGNQATGDTLVKWLQRKNLNTAGVSKMIRQSAQQSQAAQSENRKIQQQIADTERANAKKNQQDAAIKAAKDAAIAKPAFQRTVADNLAIRKAQQKGIREAVKESKQSKKSAPKQLSLGLAEGTDAEAKVSTFLSPEQIDSFILRAVQDTANQEYNANLDAQGTQSASSEPTSKSSPATSAQQSDSSELAPQPSTTQQSASSEPTTQPSPATSAQQSDSSELAPQQSTTQSSLSTSAQPKDELNDIRRLSGIVQNHENRIKNLEAGKTDNRVKFTGKKTGT